MLDGVRECQLSPALVPVPHVAGVVGTRALPLRWFRRVLGELTEKQFQSKSHFNGLSRLPLAFIARPRKAKSARSDKGSLTHGPLWGQTGNST